MAAAPFTKITPIAARQGALWKAPVKTLVIPSVSDPTSSRMPTTSLRTASCTSASFGVCLLWLDNGLDPVTQSAQIGTYPNVQK